MWTVERGGWGDRMGLFSVGLFGGSSFAVSYLSKTVITRFFFDYPIVIMMLQMAAFLFFMEIARICGVLKIQPYTFDRGKDMLIPSILYCLHSYFSLVTMEGMSLPMYGAIKRCVPIVNLYLAMAVLKKPRPSRGILIAVLLITGGAFIASIYDLMIDGWSYICGILSVVCQAVYLTWIERLSLTTQYSPMEMMYMNSFNGLTFFLIADMIQDEIRDAFMYFLTSASNLFVINFLLLLGAAGIMNFALFLCTTHNSALTTSLVTNVEAVFQIFISFCAGVYLFFEVTPTIWNLFGVCIAAFGCVFYSYEKAKEKGVDSRRTVDLSTRLG